MESIEVKRYSVFINGSISAVFDDINQAHEYINARIWLLSGMAQIWDNKKREYLYTEVCI